MKLIYFLIIGSFLFPKFSNAQYKCAYLDVFGKTHNYPSDVLNSFKKFHITPEAYDSLPESELVQAKEIIKQLDLKEKLNKSIFCTKNQKEGIYPLFDIILQGLVSGTLNAFKENKYSTKATWTCSDLISRLIKTDSVEAFYIDENGLETYEKKLQTDTITYNQIKSINFSEVWYFNKKMSRLEKRIIGFSPVWHNPKTNKDETLFWIYFNESREWLSSYASNSKAIDGLKRTYEQVFFSKFFSSTIIKESNLFNRDLLQNYSAIDALIESEKIKDNILKNEEGMWEK